GPPAEQERVGALEDLVDERGGLVGEQRQGPSAALESAPAVLIRPAESLHHSVDGDVRDGRQFHGRSSLLAEFVVVRFDRTAAPISSVAAESVRPIIPHPPRTRTGPRGLREIRASLAALDSRPLGDPLHFTLLYLRWVTPGASTARTCSSRTSVSRRLSKRRAPSPSTTGTTWSS